VPIILPDAIVKEQGGSDQELRMARPQNLQVSMNDIRLVQRIGDRDVIVDRMLIPEGESQYFEGDREKNVTAHEEPYTRLIPTTDVEIETPPRKDNEDDDSENSSEVLAADSIGDGVTAPTFQPDISSPPFHLSIIDELRNKYSKYRLRHDDDFVEKMIAIDTKAELRAKSVDLMTTPAKDLYRKQKAEAIELAKKQELTNKSLEILGTYMQNNMKDPVPTKSPRKKRATSVA
jgi:large subunit ribosomal protein L24